MAAGGIYDHVGGGFARYSTDERWLVPHFEKMLYDNALLARVYVEAYQVTGMRIIVGGQRDARLYLEGNDRHRKEDFTPRRMPTPKESKESSLSGLRTKCEAVSSMMRMRDVSAPITISRRSEIGNTGISCISPATSRGRSQGVM